MATALLSISRLAASSEPPRGTRIADARQALDHWTRRTALGRRIILATGALTAVSVAVPATIVALATHLIAV